MYVLEDNMDAVFDDILSTKAVRMSTSICCLKVVSVSCIENFVEFLSKALRPRDKVVFEAAMFPSSGENRKSKSTMTGKHLVGFSVKYRGPTPL
jgi:hypothetical protein